MDVVLYRGDLTTSPADLVAVAVLEKESRPACCSVLNKKLDGVLDTAIVDEHFTGKEKHLLVVSTLKRLVAKRVVLLGVGPRKQLSEAVWLALGKRLAKLATSVGAKQALLVVPQEFQTPATIELLSRGAALGAYRFARYRSEQSKRKPLSRLAIQVTQAGGQARLAAVVKRAAATAEATTLARDLVNEPALELYPESFAARARQVARAAKLQIRVYRAAELKRRKMNLLLAVGAGSRRPPCLIHLIYRAKKPVAKHKPLVLVGKGITFDSGGLCLKPATSMDGMKSDMAGAASVLAAMKAIAALAPARDVHGVLALAENMPSGSAIRPGDVVTGAAGKSVEIVNTDAEGRLVLADALHFARGLSPSAIIDVATLTGACVVALGHCTTGVFANDDALAAQVLGAASASGESFWRLPLTAALRPQLKSDIADLRNSGIREGGAITAALFLSEFVGETPWAHLDIAGPALEKGTGESKLASGVSVATLIALAVS